MFAIFQGEFDLRGRNISQSFLFTTNRITKYVSERFLSSRGQKMSKDVLSSIQLGRIIVSNLINVRKVTA